MFRTWTDDQIQSVVDVIMNQNDINRDGVLDAAGKFKSIKPITCMTSENNVTSERALPDLNKARL